MASRSSPRSPPTPLAFATTANAATYNADGTGFIGKGEVQSAFGMKNADLQKAVDPGKGFSFRTEQGASQSLTQALTQHATQDGTQSGTQSGTQAVSQSATQEVIETLSCTKTNGNIDQRYGSALVTAGAATRALPSAPPSVTHTVTAPATVSATAPAPDHWRAR